MVSEEIRCQFVFSEEIRVLSSSFRARMMNCRVGKGRPAGSIELRVSPSPSKIPYGGFSPVRLQMDRQWRPSSKSRGLSVASQNLCANLPLNFCEYAPGSQCE